MTRELSVDAVRIVTPVPGHLSSATSSSVVHHAGGGDYQYEIYPVPGTLPRVVEVALVVEPNGFCCLSSMWSKSCNILRVCASVCI